jgi:hypothetical protein
LLRGAGLKLQLVAVAVAVAAGGSAPSAEAKVPPLHDPVFLNIGFVCQWQDSCITKQKRAHKRSLSYMKKSKPASWKVHFCNRRATFRRTGRIDWISYYHCIRNPKISSATSTSTARR